ncbi:unnamed protein product [Heligmosomoides polygyrus]|uniref:Secreted protein n=1 Tax=Heligmosomoides polygyrus TaxID=6339 RepID=A0A183G2E9_HELPZ|nr:unnamed protein product [Heligmosomoides polygyrus]
MHFWTVLIALCFLFVALTEAQFPDPSCRPPACVAKRRRSVESVTGAHAAAKHKKLSHVLQQFHLDVSGELCEPFDFVFGPFPVHSRSVEIAQQ